MTLLDKICEELGVEVGKHFKIEGYPEHLLIHPTGIIFYGDNTETEIDGITCYKSHNINNNFWELLISEKVKPVK